MSIPDPAFFDRPGTVTEDVAGLDRSELGVHLQAVWLTPVTDEFDVTFSAGPSFIRVTQQVATVIVPLGTQTINVTQESQSGTALGINVRLHGSYMFRPQIGAGMFIRYAGGAQRRRVGKPFQARSTGTCGSARGRGPSRPHAQFSSRWRIASKNISAIRL